MSKSSSDSARLFRDMLMGVVAGVLLILPGVVGVWPESDKEDDGETLDRLRRWSFVFDRRSCSLHCSGEYVLDPPSSII